MAGFSEEVPRLATTSRRHCLYDDRWFRFPGLAAELGIVWLGPRVAQEASSVFPLRDSWVLASNVQGQQSCMALVPSRTGNQEKLQDRISDVLGLIQVERDPGLRNCTRVGSGIRSGDLS